MEDSWKQYLPEGFTARPSTLDDAQAATDVFNASTLKYTGRTEFDLEQTLEFWQMPRFDLAQHSRVVLAPDGRIVANFDINDTAPTPSRLVVWGRVHPDYEGLGIETALLAWAEQYAHAAIPRALADACVSLLVAGTPEAAVPTIQLLENNGYHHSRSFWRMAIQFTDEPSAPRWPLGIRLSNMAERPDLTPAVAAKEEAFRDHSGHVERPFEESVEVIRHRLESDALQDLAGWLLALDGEEIGGICWCRLGEFGDPETGWVGSLGVRRPYRGQGIGMALLQAAFRFLHQHDFKRAGLTVDASSLTGATRLYEKAGMTIQQRYMDFEKELRPGH